MDDLANWCSGPPVPPHCLIKIGPGVFDLGTTTLFMQPYVDIEGAGIGTTVLTGDGITPLFLGVVHGSDNAELRHLTVERVNGFHDFYRRWFAGD